MRSIVVVQPSPISPNLGKKERGGVIIFSLSSAPKIREVGGGRSPPSGRVENWAPCSEQTGREGGGGEERAPNSDGGVEEREREESKLYWQRHASAV